MPVPGGLSAWRADGSTLVPLPEEPAAIPSLLLEVVRVGTSPRLLLIDRAGLDIRVNDQKPPGMVLLRSGDLVRIQFGDPVEVALHHQVRIGPPPPDQAGTTCPMCLGPVKADSTAYQCPSCSTFLHLEDEGDDPLQCALAVTQCPRCATAIRLTEGYLTEPALLGE